MCCFKGSGSKGRGSSRQHTCPRSSALTAVLLVLLLGSSAHAAPRQQFAARKLLQVTATSSAPVSINQPAAATEPQVTATGGPALDAFKSAAADTLGSLFHKKEKVVEAAPAPVATIVVPQPQVAAVPTTTSGISLKTDTPVSLASPINVTTPVKQKNVQIGGGGGGQDLLNTLINLGNLGANTAAAGGAITGAVAGFLNTFLPDCPPPIPDAPPIPGCQLIGGDLGNGLNGLLGALPVGGGIGGGLLPSTVVNVNSPGATGTDVNALSLSTARTDAAAAAAGARPGPGGAKPRSASSPKPAVNPPSPKAPAKPAASGPAQPKSPIQVFTGILGWP